MYDYGLSTLEQYGLNAEGYNRIRGALLCQTEKGSLILKEFQGSEKKLVIQQELLQMLETKGFHTDCYLENNEGKLISEDKDHIFYTLQYYQEGRECDTRSREDLKKSMAHLACIHKVMHLPFQEIYQQRNLVEEYTRHNQELKKIRKFIRKKNPENIFEKIYLASAEDFLEKGEEALRELKNSSYEMLREEAKKMGTICHGEYHQHNVWFMTDGVTALNFSHWNYDVQIADVYRFLRKILEKYNWDVGLARTLLTAYHKEKRITPEEWENLRIRFQYPEKYWKIADYYYSHKKAWISEKNVEKLQSVVNQRRIWEDFTQKCFSDYPF